jgi:hypothetical protein
MELVNRSIPIAMASLVVALAAASIPLPVRAQDDVRQRANEILERAVTAMGGADLIDHIETMIVKSRDKRETPAGWVNVQTRSYFRYPAWFRQEIEINGKTVAMATTPTEAYLLTDSSFVELSAADKQSVEVTAMRNLVSVLKSRSIPKFKIASVKADTIDGRAVDEITVWIRDENTAIAIDRATGRVVRQTYFTGDRTDPEKDKIVVSYSDFRREPSGLTIATHAQGKRNGAVVFDSFVESVEVNLRLPPGLFGPAPAEPRSTIGAK